MQTRTPRRLGSTRPLWRLRCWFLLGSSATTCGAATPCTGTGSRILALGWMAVRFSSAPVAVAGMLPRLVMDSYDLVRWDDPRSLGDAINRRGVRSGVQQPPGPTVPTSASKTSTAAITGGGPPAITSVPIAVARRRRVRPRAFPAARCRSSTKPRGYPRIAPPFSPAGLAGLRNLSG